MKKLFTIVIFVLLYGVTNAQNYIHMNITEVQDWTTYVYCTSECDGVVIEKEPGCEEWWHWYVVIDGHGYDYSSDEIILTPYGNLDASYWITYSSLCGIGEKEFYVKFNEFQVNEPFIENYIWKRLHESIALSCNVYVGGDCSCQWSTGSTNSSITVTEPGTYWVHIYNDCGELYDTIQVRDNVEIDLATCDLGTNLNMVTWQTTTAQAEYVDHVIIKRDGLEVGTANYSDGFFLDNIGSDLAQRTYTVIAVDTDGSQCPIVSYPKGTIHMAYLTGVNNTIEVNWNIPTGYDLLGYNICEWIPNGKDGELNVIDFVGASVTSYTCQVSQFTSGYVIIQGVEAGKSESRLLSNRSSETVGIGEYGMDGFKVYPNPANGIFTVEGTGRLSVMNLLGQEIVDQEIEGKTTLGLPQGIYFVKLNDATQKIVVE